MRPSGGGLLVEPVANEARRRVIPTIGLLVVLAAYLAAAGLFNVLHPIWEAPDEANHYAFVRYLAEQRSLPEVVPFWGGRLGGETEAHQPPLYYAIQALLVGWVDDGTEAEWHRNPYATWPDHPARLAIALHRLEEDFPYKGYVLGVHLARLVSTLMGAGTVVMTFFLARRLTRNNGTAILAAALAAFTPGFAFISAMVNNDNGVTLATALVLWHCVRLLQGQNVTWRDGLVSGLLLSVAVLMKLSALPLVGVVGVTWALIVWRERRQRATQVLSAAAPLPAVCLALVAWWPLIMRDEWELVRRNAAVDVPAAGLLPPPMGYNPQHVVDGLVLTFQSYWGHFGWADELMLPNWVYAPVTLLCLIAGLGLVRLVARKRPQPHALTSMAPLAILGLFALGSAYLVFNLYQHQPTGYMRQGRYLYPALPVFATLLALGIRAVANRWPTAGALPALFLAGVTFAVPLTISRDSFVPPYPVWGIFDEASIARRLDLPYANGATYLGLSVQAGDLRPGETLEFESYWRADADLTEDMLAAFRLVDPTGEAPVSDHGVPQERSFPPHLWQRGEVVPDPRRLALPDDALPGAYRLQMRLLDHTGVVDVPPRAGDSGQTGWVDIAQLRVRPPGKTAPEVSLPEAVAFGGQLSLIGYDEQRDSRGGEDTLAVTLYWRAVVKPDDDYTISLQLLDGEGKLRAQHDGMPHDGRYPTSRWDVGEVIPDRHVVTLPNDLGSGGRAVVIVYRASDGKRLPVAGGEMYKILHLSAVP